MNQETLKVLQEELVRQRVSMESLLNQVDVNRSNVLLWKDQTNKTKVLLQNIDNKIAAILN